MRQKTHFFQDLLLSTLTDRKLTVKVTGLACPSSSSCFSSGSPSDKHSKAPSDSKNKRKRIKKIIIIIPDLQIMRIRTWLLSTLFFMRTFMVCPRRDFPYKPLSILYY